MNNLHIFSDDLHAQKKALEEEKILNNRQSLIPCNGTSKIQASYKPAALMPKAPRPTADNKDSADLGKFYDILLQSKSLLPPAFIR